MKYNIFLRAVNILIITLPFLIFKMLILGIGGGGVLNDLYEVLAEIESLEQKKLLNETSVNISDFAKLQIETFHDSVELKKYIKETELMVSNIENALLILVGLFLLCLVIKIYFGKKY